MEEDLLREIARGVVERVAPHELVLFHAESTAYFRDPHKALKAARKRAAAQPKDERFGFGGGELIAIVTPLVLAMVETALVGLGADLMVRGAERSAGPVRARIRRLLRRPDPTQREESAAEDADAPEGPEPSAAPAPATDTTPGAVIDASAGSEGNATDGAPPPAPRAGALPPELTETVRQQVYEQALRFGIDEDGARLLADAVIGGLTA